MLLVASYVVSGEVLGGKGSGRGDVVSVKWIGIWWSRGTSGPRSRVKEDLVKSLRADFRVGRGSRRGAETWVVLTSACFSLMVE